MDRQYDISRLPVSVEEELERLRVQVSMGWEKEYQNLQRFGLSDGMKILDLGCGPAFVTEKLLMTLRNAEISAVDIDASLLKYAKEQITDVEAKSRVRFVEASAYETGLPDNYYDFAIARLLFLHLSDPVLAAKEVLRVLKPGGKFVIIDVDDALLGIFEPEIDSLSNLMKVVAQQKAARGGNRYIGRHLPRVLKGAGYQDIDMDAIVHHSDLHGIEGFKHQIDPTRFSWFLKSGLISQGQYDSLKNYSQSFGQPDTYAIMLFFMGCGTKPQRLDLSLSLA